MLLAAIKSDKVQEVVLVECLSFSNNDFPFPHCIDLRASGDTANLLHGDYKTTHKNPYRSA